MSKYFLLVNGAVLLRTNDLHEAGGVLDCLQVIDDMPDETVFELVIRNTGSPGTSARGYEPWMDVRYTTIRSS